MEPINPQAHSINAGNQDFKPIDAAPISTPAAIQRTTVEVVQKAAPVVVGAIHTYKDDAAHPSPVPPGVASKSPLGTSSLVKTSFEKVMTQMLPELATPDEAHEMQKQMENFIYKGIPLEDPALQTIALQAGKEISETFGLKEIYNPGMDIRIENVGNPIALAEVRQEVLRENLAVFAENIFGAAKQVNFPPNDPRSVSMKEFLTIIANALKEIQDTLMESQLTEAESLEKNEGLQKQLQKEASETTDKGLDTKRKEMAKQASMAKFGFAMKILGPTITALATVAGAALAFLSGGALTPLLVAGIAVGLAMTAYSVVDSTTGVTSKIMEGLNSLVEKMCEDLPEWTQPLVKAAIVAGAVVAAALIVIATSGGASASVATQTVAQFAQEATKMAVKQLAIQAAVIILMSSNVVVENVEMMAKGMGLGEKATNIIKYTTLVLEMVALIAVSYKAAGGGGGGAKAAGTGAQAATQEAQSIVDKATTFVTQAAKATAQEVADTAKAIKEAVKEIVNSITSYAKDLYKFLASIKNLPTRVVDNIKETIASFVELFAREDLWTHLLTKLTEAQPEIAKKILTFIKNAPAGLNVISASVNGAMSISMAKLLKSEAKIDEMMALLNALIDMVKKLISALLSGISDIAETLGEFANSLVKLISQQEDVASSIARPIQD